jgi:hypothetical protein
MTNISQNLKEISREFKRAPKKAFIRIAFLVVILAALPVSIFLVRSFNERRSNAQVAASTATLSFSPTTLSLTSNDLAGKSVVLRATTSTKVGFIRADIPFDKTKVKVTNIQYSQYFIFDAYAVSPTPMTINPPSVFTKTADQANTAGKLTLLFLLKPSYQSSTSPVGTFDLATITFAANTTSANQTNELAIDSATVQVVDTDCGTTGVNCHSNTSTTYPLTLTNTSKLLINVNPSLTNTPTTKPSNTPTTKPTVTGTITSTPKKGDFDHDGDVDVIDYGILLDNFGKSPIPNTETDLDNDGDVDVIDYGILLDNWTR